MGKGGRGRDGEGGVEMGKCGERGRDGGGGGVEMGKGGRGRDGKVWGEGGGREWGGVG